MLQIRKADDRGHADFGWLDTRYSFSFGEYFDEDHMGFGPIRVINDDRIAGGGGFPAHPHANMEIVTYVLSGALEHKDSLGTGSVIRPGDVQRMSAGTGIRHSEFNASETEPVHLLQIWIVPETRGLAPGYEQKQVSAEEKRGRLRLIGAPDGGEGVVTIHQDVRLYATLLQPGESVTHRLDAARSAWVQVATGAAEVNGTKLRAGDGLAIADEGEVRLTGTAGNTELLLFDVVA